MTTQINTKAETLQAMVLCKGLKDLHGKLMTKTLESADGKLKISLPVEAFPFVDANDQVIAIISIIRNELQEDSLPGLAPSGLIKPAVN